MMKMIQTDNGCNVTSCNLYPDNHKLRGDESSCMGVSNISEPRFLRRIYHCVSKTVSKV